MIPDNYIIFAAKYIRLIYHNGSFTITRKNFILIHFILLTFKTNRL